MGEPLARTTKSSPSLGSRGMLLYGFIAVLCLARPFESAPLGSVNDSTRHESAGTLGSGLPTKKGQEEEVGNPSELAWQAWLLVDGHPGSQASGAMDSASLLRRITPKSIFIAPALTECPEGYQDDTMNRCVKDVNIDHQAHMGFLVERLKAIYGNVGKPQASSSSSSSASSIPTGPLQLSIPLILPASVKVPIETKKPEPQELENAPGPVEPLTIAGEAADPGSGDRHREAIVTVYELNEEARRDEEGRDKAAETRPGLTVPVAEFVDDPSGESAVEKTANRTRLGVEGTRDRDTVNETDVSPTVVLLLSPTKVPSISLPGSDLIVAHNSSLGQVIIKMENVTGNATAKEIIRVSVADDVSPSTPAKIELDGDVEETTTDPRTEVDLVSGDEKTGDDDGELEDEEPSTEGYPEEAYEESTEIEDEILKHSEAGMTVTIAGSAKPTTTEAPSVNDDGDTTGSSEISSEVSVNGDFVRETTLVDFNLGKSSNSTTGTTSSTIEETSTVVPTDPDGPEHAEAVTDPTVGSTNSKPNVEPSETQDEPSSPKDSEKTIETAIPEKTEVRPEVVYPVSSIEDLIAEEMKAEASSTEKSVSAETMVGASSNDAGQAVSREPPRLDTVPSAGDKKRRGQPFRFSDVSSTTTRISSSFSNVEGVYDYAPLQRDYQRRPAGGFTEDESLPVIRTMDEQRYRPEDDDERRYFGSQQDHTYVRFPTYNRHERPNYVRFPSDEVNSIHSRADYKDRSRRPYGQQYEAPDHTRGSQTRTLPGQETRQRQSYWWVPPGWRTDRQQSDQQRVAPQRSRSGGALEQRPRDRAPMLLRFWTRMPLVRDPSLAHQQHTTYPSFGSRSRADSRLSSSHAQSRRVNYYKEMSTQDLSRAFARQTLPSAIGG